MQPTDYLYIIVLVAVALYAWRREPPRLLLSPLLIVSFGVLYGLGIFVYYAGAETVPEIRSDVSISLVIMWLAIILGMELARAIFPAMNIRSQQVTVHWSSVPLSDKPVGDGMLCATGLLMAAVIFGIFFALGKPAQIAGFLALESTLDKQKYRLELAGQGGYLYQTLIASIAPFMSFLLLLKAKVNRSPAALFSGIMVVLAVFAGKLGTFHKVPWVVYMLQLVVVMLAARRLELGLGRMALVLVLLVAGTGLAAAIALPELDTVGIGEWLIYRFFEINNEVIYQTYYVYPEHIPHTWGMNIGVVQRLFGSGELVSAHTQVANFFGASGATFDAFFIADAWVDFGFVGVAAMSLLVGFVVKGIDLSILNLDKTPLALALLGGSLYGLFQIQVTSAFTAFLSGGLLLIPLVVYGSVAIATDLNRSVSGLAGTGAVRP